MFKLPDEIVFKYIERDQKIIFMRIDELSDFIIILKSQDYCSDFYKMLLNEISFSTFQQRLPSNARIELNQTIDELKLLGIIQSENVVSKINGQNFQGDFFSVSVELITKALMVSAVTYSEGEACGSVGQTYCETNSGNASFPRELWECTPGPPPNWAAMGMSC